MMAIEKVEIESFLVFKDSFNTTFCPGVNVIIGGNGTGKTTLLKAMYMICDLAKTKYKERDITLDNHAWIEPNEDLYTDETITPYFQNIENERGLLSSLFDEAGVLIGERELIKMLFPNKNTKKGFLKITGVDETREFVFIPASDMLAHSKGFLSLYKDLQMPFDATHADVLSKAGRPITRNITPIASKVISKIKELIGGEVVFENDIYYIKKEDGSKVPFSLEASGYKKLGLLWKLLRNGLLENGNILFWDEPENSLNPEIVPVIVDILLEISRNGVQVFIATHSEILAGYFAVNRQKTDEVLFTALYREADQIKANTENRFDLLEPNSLADEPVKLYKKELVRGLGGNG